MSRPPGIFSPRWWRLFYVIVREGVAYRRSRGAQ
jgi:hypothetical protein